MNVKSMTLSVLCTTLLFTTVNADNDYIDESKTPPKIIDIEDVSLARPIKLDYHINTKLSNKILELKTYSTNIINLKDINEKEENIFNLDIDKKIVRSSENGVSSIIHLNDKGDSIKYFSRGQIFYSREPLFLKTPEDLLKIRGLNKISAKEFYLKKAKSFLKEHNLLSDDIYFEKISYATVTESPSKSNPKPRSKIVGVSVKFNSKINNIPTWGAGTGISIDFDKKGICGYFNKIPNINTSTAKNVNLISANTAVKRYISQNKPKNLLKSYSGKVKTIIIRDAKLIYHLKEVNKLQKEIKPYYLITGVFIGLDQKGKEIKSEFQWLESAIQ